MSSLEQRLKIFKELPLRAQLAMIQATIASPILSQNRDYIAQLQDIHAQCLENANPEARKAYFLMKNMTDK